MILWLVIVTSVLVAVGYRTERKIDAGIVIRMSVVALVIAILSGTARKGTVHEVLTLRLNSAASAAPMISCSLLLSTVLHYTLALHKI